MALNPSALTFDQLRAGGIHGALDAVIAANPSLSTRARDNARAALNVLTKRTQLDSWLGGSDVPDGDVVVQSIDDMTTALDALRQANAEASDLVEANPGTISHRTSPSYGTRIVFRQWP